LFSQNFSDRVSVMLGNSVKQPVKGGQNFVLEAMDGNRRTMRWRIRTLNVFDPLHHLSCGNGHRKPSIQL
jgi:hypothetical protein